MKQALQKAIQAIPAAVLLFFALGVPPFSMHADDKPAVLAPHEHENPLNNLSPTGVGAVVIALVYLAKTIHELVTQKNKADSTVRDVQAIFTDEDRRKLEAVYIGVHDTLTHYIPVLLDLSKRLIEMKMESTKAINDLSHKIDDITKEKEGKDHG